MNREIKFRAWLKHRRTKIMCKVEQIDFDAKRVFLSDNILLGWYSFDEIEFMQYVGLKDKNGVEIFEGDIVKTYSGDTYVVYFDERSGAFGLITGSPYEDRKWFDDISNMVVINNSEVYKNLEVITNIYENKELLENE